MRFSAQEAAARTTLSDGRVITRCDSCREMWAERSQRAGEQLLPPCEDCGQVDLQQENLIAARIFYLVRNQVRLAFNGQFSQELDLDFTAVWAVIDRYPAYGVKVSKWDIFERIVAAYRELKKDSE